MAAHLSLKNIPDHVAEALRARARRHGRSLEAEVLAILDDAVAADRRSIVALLDEIRATKLATPSDATRMIREDRDAR